MRVHLSVLLLVLASLVLCLTAGCSRDATLPEDISSTQAGLSDSPRDPTDAESGASGDIVAWVNDTPIAQDDIDRAQAQLLLQYRGIYTPLGIDLDAMFEGAQGRLFQLRIRSEALEMATMRVLIAEELSQRDAQVSQAEVDAEFQATFDDFLLALDMSEQELSDAFAQGGFSGFETGGLSFDQFIANTKQTIREDFEMQAILPLLTGPIERTEDDLIAYFEQHRSDYEVDEAVRVSHILVADKEIAQLALEELEEGVAFDKLARDFSLDEATSTQGGDLGWFGRGKMVQAFEDVAFDTPKGEFGIAQTDHGYHVIAVTDRQDAQRPAYEDVADVVAEDFDAEVMDRAFRQWDAAAYAAASITISDDMLKAYRKLQQSKDQGLQAFLELRERGDVEDPYLSYIIGTIYESKMSEAQSAKSAFDAYMTLTPAMQTEVERLEAEIRANRDEALAFYSECLAGFGEHAEIEARIASLTPSLR